MTAPEFSRLVDVRQSAGKHLHLEASEAERLALARRFALQRIDSLEADLDLDRYGETVDVSGRLRADLVQSCAISGEDLPQRIDEPVALRFIPAGDAQSQDLDLEIDSGQRDEVEYEGSEFDIGEAMAQSLALAIDPFATGPNAEEARKKAGLGGEAASGPFAALARLKPKPGTDGGAG